MATTSVFWPGSGSYPNPTTLAFETFADDEDFNDEAPKLAKWICTTLGYPVMAVELADYMIYQQFEAAIMKYSSTVNEFNIRENLLALQGQSTASNLTQTTISPSPLPFIIEISQQYGVEAGSGGDVDWKKGYIDTVADQQDYDLQEVWAAVSESGNRIEIRRLFHERLPAISRGGFGFGDVGYGPNDGSNNLLGEFGWAGFDGGLNGNTGAGTVGQFMIMPIYETLLRTQAIEFNDQIRRSQFSFEVHNNKLRIIPRPATGMTPRIWFHYTVKQDRFHGSSGSLGGNPGSTISDASNAPYGFMTYASINSVGRQWIYQYCLALCKKMLGRILSKYESMPTPNGENMRLDGPMLRQEGQQEQEELLTHLRETLAEAGRAKQMEKMAQNEQFAQDILNHVPLPFYIF